MVIEIVLEKIPSLIKMLVIGIHRAVLRTIYIFSSDALSMCM